MKFPAPTEFFNGLTLIFIGALLGFLGCKWLTALGCTALATA